jgi:hypothetical protein
MSHVFISYSKQDREFARSLADFLLEQGFDVWIDDRIPFGDRWWNVIVQAIMGCSAFIVIMTPESQSSKWVDRELGLADHLDKPLFPLLVQGDNWPIFVRTQYADLRVGGMPTPEFCERLSACAPRQQRTGAHITQEIPVSDLVSADVMEQLEQALEDREGQSTEPLVDDMTPDGEILRQLDTLLEGETGATESRETQDDGSTAGGANDEALSQLDQLLG